LYGCPGIGLQKIGVQLEVHIMAGKEQQGPDQKQSLLHGIGVLSIPTVKLSPDGNVWYQISINDTE
jgi:hypothetical protein